MHEIAFQADKRFAGWSVCIDCSLLFILHGSILFGITFTRKIYSTLSRFSPRRWLVVVTGGQTEPPVCCLWIIVLSDYSWIGFDMSCHAVT